MKVGRELSSRELILKLIVKEAHPGHQASLVAYYPLAEVKLHWQLSIAG
jgi:hypothetical protein